MKRLRPEREAELSYYRELKKQIDEIDTLRVIFNNQLRERIVKTLAALDVIRARALVTPFQRKTRKRTK